jgi:hypothetical protein
MRQFIAEHQHGYRELMKTAEIVRREVGPLKTDLDAKQIMLSTCDLTEKPIGKMTREELEWLATMILVAEKQFPR